MPSPDGVQRTLYINKNAIVAYEYTRNECLQIKLDYNRISGHDLPREYTICRDTNTVAYDTVFSGYAPMLGPSKYK